MVRYCFVVGCNKYTVVHTGTKFYRIPKGITKENKKFVKKSRAGLNGLSKNELIILSERRREMWISVLVVFRVRIQNVNTSGAYFYFFIF